MLTGREFAHHIFLPDHLCQEIIVLASFVETDTTYDLIIFTPNILNTKNCFGLTFDFKVFSNQTFFYLNDVLNKKNAAPKTYFVHTDADMQRA